MWDGPVRSSEDICIARDLVRKSLAGAMPRHLKAFLLHQAGFTLKEIGEMFGVTQERIRQMEHKVFERGKANARRDRYLMRFAKLPKPKKRAPRLVQIHPVKPVRSVDYFMGAAATRMIKEGNTTMRRSMFCQALAAKAQAYIARVWRRIQDTTPWLPRDIRAKAVAGIWLGEPKFSA